MFIPTYVYVRLCMCVAVSLGCVCLIYGHGMSVIRGISVLLRLFALPSAPAPTCERAVIGCWQAEPRPSGGAGKERPAADPTQTGKTTPDDATDGNGEPERDTCIWSERQWIRSHATMQRLFFIAACLLHC